MTGKRILYWLALAVAGLSSLGLKLWALLTWSNSGESWTWTGVHHWGWGLTPWSFGPPILLVLLVVAAVVWYRRKGGGFRGSFANPWEALGLEYVEGRIGREEFLARRAVLEE
jgi:hypothetical protein